MIDTLDVNFLDYASVDRFLKGYSDVKKSDIKNIIAHFDLNGNGKVTFNEFALALSPSTRAPKIEDIPEIVSYSPRKTAMNENLPPRFDDSYLPTNHQSASKKKQSRKGTKISK